MASVNLARAEQHGSPGKPLAGIDGHQADQALPVGPGQGRTAAKHGADIARALRRHASQAEIVEGGAAVDLRPGDMALFHPQRAQRLDAVGFEAMRFAGFEEPAPCRLAAACADIDLIGQFAGIAQPQDAQRPAVEVAFEKAHMRQRGVRKVEAFERFGQDLAAVRSGDRHRRPFVGDGGHRHPQVRPHAVEQEFEPGQDVRRLCRRSRHEEAMFAKTRRRAVVEDDAVVAQHDAVAGAPDRQPGEANAITGRPPIFSAGTLRPAF